MDEGIAKLRAEYPNIRLLLASLGPDGSRAYLGDMMVEQAAFLNPATTDTTGAGDTFCACCLDAVLTNGLDMAREQMQQMLRFANAAASLVTTRKGALRVMPERTEVAGVFSDECYTAGSSSSLPFTAGRASQRKRSLPFVAHGVCANPPDMKYRNNGEDDRHGNLPAASGCAQGRNAEAVYLAVPRCAGL